MFPRKNANYTLKVRAILKINQKITLVTSNCNSIILLVATWWKCYCWVDQMGDEKDLTSGKRIEVRPGLVKSPNHAFSITFCLVERLWSWMYIIQIPCDQIVQMWACASMCVCMYAYLPSKQKLGMLTHKQVHWCYFQVSVPKMPSQWKASATNVISMGPACAGQNAAQLSGQETAWPALASENCTQEGCRSPRPVSSHLSFCLAEWWCERLHGIHQSPMVASSPWRECSYLRGLRCIA